MHAAPAALDGGVDRLVVKPIVVMVASADGRTDGPSLSRYVKMASDACPGKQKA
jgi:hypothetical protein